MAGFKSKIDIKNIKAEIVDMVHQPAIDTVNDNIEIINNNTGIIENLTTTDKTSTVKAINENVTKITSLIENAGIDATKGIETSLPIRLNKINTSLETNAQHIKNTGIYVNDYGVPYDGVTNASTVLQTLIDSLADGFTLIFNGKYLLNTSITFGAKNFNVLTSPNTEFQGTGSMPSLQNFMHKIQGNTFRSTPLVGKPSGGDSALSVEILPGENYLGNACGFFTSARAGTTLGEIWGANIMVNVEEGYTRNSWGLEIDVNSHSANASVIKGLDITGEGDYNPDIGLIVNRATGRPIYTPWVTGLIVQNALQGALITGDEKGLKLTADTALLELQCTRTTGHSTNSVINLKNSDYLLVTDLRENGDFTTNSVKTVEGIFTPNSLTSGYTKMTKQRYATVQTPVYTVLANSVVEHSLALTGCKIGDNVYITPVSTIPMGLTWCAWVASNDNIRIRIANSTVASISCATINFQVVANTLVTV